jgi:hypothetical protein
MKKTGWYISFFLIIVTLTARGQTTTYKQFWNEFAFTKTLKCKWSTELNLGQSYTSTGTNTNIFSRAAQYYPRLWIHYNATARWKLSLFYAYFFNQYVPEIEQREYTESRLALQGIYYIHKVRYTLSTRFRVEDRHIENTDGYYEGLYRFRTQIKLLYPFNSKFIRKNTVYGIGSNELYFKTPSNVTGSQFFDRNRLTLGTGYAVTDDFQVELTYVNEYLPRSGNNEIINAMQLNFSFNNLFPNLKKRFTKQDGGAPDQ